VGIYVYVYMQILMYNCVCMYVFVFMITIQMLHRMSVFRDDIGRNIYLCIYVDTNIQLYVHNMYLCLWIR